MAKSIENIKKLSNFWKNRNLLCYATVLKPSSVYQQANTSILAAGTVFQYYI